MKLQLSAIGIGLLLVAGAAQAGSLQVDKKKSEIKVNIRATGHSFTGVLKDYQLTASATTSPILPRAINLKWKFSDLDTDNAKRDKEMVHWLGGGNPEGSFKYTKSWAEKDGSRKAMGDLTINGVTKTISFPYTAQIKDGAMVADGSVWIDYSDFKLPTIRSMALMTVNPKLEVVFHLEGKAN